MESKQPGGASGPQTYSHVRVKEENYGEATGGPTLKVTFQKHGTYSISCDRPCTVLEALKSSQIYNALKWSDENLVIQLGAEQREVTIATHFPCSCIDDGTSLEISHKPKVVEVKDKSSMNTVIYSRDKYSLLYIDTVGGTNAESKKLFKNNAVKKFKYLCVYGEKGMTVEEALQRDGRFSDDLCNFTLCCQKIKYERSQKVDTLHGNKFNILLPQDNTLNAKKTQEKTGLSADSQNKTDTRPGLENQKGISVMAAVEKSCNSDDTDKIYALLRDQFPALKELMQSRFPGESYQEALKLRKENFGKIQQSFSEVHRVRRLLELGRSVCKVIVKDVCEGSGFVLFDNFILTNAHLFEGCVEAETLKKGVEVSVLFNHDDPEPYTNYCSFEVVNSYICPEEDNLDYAVLQLNTEGKRISKLNTQTQKKIKIPPGLLKNVGPMPPNGEACLIGHPGGKLKKMDPTCIIEKEKRGQAVGDKLHPYRDSIFILQSISHLISEQGIENIMIGGKLAEKGVTYDTFMYHGSSGCPVFDAQCKVFGLHTAGYVYGFPKHEESVIEFAFSLDTILEHFENKLKTKGDEVLLKRFKKAAMGNTYLQEVLQSVSEAQVVKAEPADFENCSDSSGPMETD